MEMGEEKAHIPLWRWRSNIDMCSGSCSYIIIVNFDVPFTGHSESAKILIMIIIARMDTVRVRNERREKGAITPTIWS